MDYPRAFVILACTSVMLPSSWLSATAAPGPGQGKAPGVASPASAAQVTPVTAPTVQWQGREGSVQAPVQVPRSGFAPAVPVNGVVTNEWAYWNATSSQAVRSPDWQMTSGSLFARNGSWWTGRVDDREPDARSATATNSAVFRLTSRRTDLRDVAVDMTLVPRSMTATPTTPAVAWDGTHLFLRYQSEASMYYASVARRDGHVVLKKKCAGGPSNGGTYVTLAESAGHSLANGAPRRVGASVRTLADGSVELTLRHAGSTILRAVDSGLLCAPITAAGAVGVRGDNAEFDFRDFVTS